MECTGDEPLPGGWLWLGRRYRPDFVEFGLSLPAKRFDSWIVFELQTCLQGMDRCLEISLAVEFVSQPCEEQSVVLLRLLPPHRIVPQGFKGPQDAIRNSPPAHEKVLQVKKEGVLGAASGAKNLRPAAPVGKQQQTDHPGKHGDPQGGVHSTTLLAAALSGGSGC